MITGRSRSMSGVDHQTGWTSWIARGQVDALSTDIVGDARIARVTGTSSRAAIRATLTVTVRVEEDRNGPVLPQSLAMEKHQSRPSTA